MAKNISGGRKVAYYLGMVIMIKCRDCGKLNEVDSKFCQECGKKI